MKSFLNEKRMRHSLKILIANFIAYIVASDYFMFP